jgi:FlaA1/EpsC-like NDP-sugar epimerase
MNYIKNLLNKRYAPRWVILLIDMFLCILSVCLAYLLRFNFNINEEEIHEKLFLNILLFTAVRFIGFYIFKTYHGVIRYTSTHDAKSIFMALTSGSLFLVCINLLLNFSQRHYFVPYSILIIEYFTTALMIMAFRIVVKMIYAELKSNHIEKKNVVIFGGGESGLITKRTIDQDKDSKRKIIGFFDDDPLKTGKSLEGVRIYSFEDSFEQLVNKHRIDELIISIQILSRERKEEIVDSCVANGVQVKTVPPATQWINGEFNVKEISDFKIEDLLEREPIHLDQDKIDSQINNKVVLVTGACGSIGSELVNQIIRFYPKEIILIDQAETPLYELELALRETSSFVNFKTILADIYNRSKMEEIISNFKPEIIYHAAAYKHVPLMEDNAAEAVMTNIAGTRNLADLAVAYGVKTFVQISTDKAVNPTNVMGASKRVAEIYVQALNSYLESQNLLHTNFITTRFGNVLGSNGSVIPRFRKQISAGGPITVTHPEISRYFMTIPEACQLILEAGMMGNGGEIFIFDMGEPVKIIDLAKRMTILSGLKIGKDINIVYTGLRPGEKIKEELLNIKEKTIPTHHPKIMIAKVSEYPYEVVAKEIQELISMTGNSPDKKIVSKIKAIVPEYLSNNSKFEELDIISLPDDVKKSVSKY